MTEQFKQQIETATPEQLEKIKAILAANINTKPVSITNRHRGCVVAVCIYLAINYEDYFAIFAPTMIIAIVSMIVLIGLVITMFLAFGAEHRAELLNAELGTNYTPEQIF